MKARRTLQTREPSRWCLRNRRERAKKPMKAVQRREDTDIHVHRVAQRKCLAVAQNIPHA